MACTKEAFDPVSKQRIAVSRYGERDGWIDGYIDLWLDDPAKEHISILGEFGTLYCTIHSQPIPPDKPPSLRQAVRWIAQLGGFLGRRHDGEPGVKTIWRGWQRLQDIAATWQLLHSHQGTQPQL